MLFNNICSFILIATLDAWINEYNIFYKFLVISIGDDKLLASINIAKTLFFY